MLKEKSYWSVFEFLSDLREDNERDWDVRPGDVKVEVGNFVEFLVYCIFYYVLLNITNDISIKNDNNYRVRVALSSLNKDSNKRQKFNKTVKRNDKVKVKKKKLKKLFNSSFNVLNKEENKINKEIIQNKIKSVLNVILEVLEGWQQKATKKSTWMRTEKKKEDNFFL